MSKEGKNKMVPELRFPEFRNADKWCIESLKEVYSFKSTNSFSREDLNYGRGEVKNIHYGDIHTKFSTQFDITKEKVPFINPPISIENIDVDNYCQEGDIIFADASEDLKDVGKSIEIVNLNNERLLSGMHTLLARRKQNKLIVGFGGYLFMADAIRSLIQREAQGTKVLGISATRISNIEIFYPVDKNEQQKIADCLSSLNDLLTAENQKLEALKAHKKGLMQQLFPPEGETVPKRRFAEFKDSGEWAEKSLGRIGEPLMCKRIFKEQTTSDASNGIPFYKIGTFGKVPDSFISIDLYNNYKSKFSFPKIGDVLISAAGTIGRLVVYNGSPAYFQDSNIVWLLNNEALVLNSFLFHYYSKITWQTSDGGIISRLYNSDLKKMKILFPEQKEEQQKIVDCLSSLDKFITAQTEKIEALTQHKKGLMQGLFPNIENL